MNCLFIADIVGKPGRRVVAEMVPALRREFAVDVCVANCENASAGKGITVKVAQALFTYGIDILTSGNHVWDRKEILPFMQNSSAILRPANYPPGTIGSGSLIFHLGNGFPVGVLNLQGRVFMRELDCPFRVAVKHVEELHQVTRIVFVDFHAEATSEKMAMGWYLDGKVSAVIGTHTHVQTADERILPGGTAYITDVGMTGPHDSIIGIQTDVVLNRFLTQMPARFSPADGNLKFCGVVITVEAQTGKALHIQRLMLDLQNKEEE
ncbi:MAG: TIGR00282 family metallophosphoesterase [Gemmatimonadota bacterium]|nr:MAG: TIGR00282 family metallophosphoesterase [Gemmatimonadota bacterium]